VPGSLGLSLLLALAGVAAGVVNTLAGGGSLLTLPALIFLGLPADVANATNRVGVLLQSAVGVATHHRLGHMPWRAAPGPLVITAVGAAVGALLAIALGRDGLRPAIGAALLIALPLVFWPMPRAEGDAAARRGAAAGAARILGLFAAGVYGGFVQAGVGIVLLAVLSGLGGLRLERANALKLLLVGAFTIPALLLFVAEDLVEWVPGFALAAGSMLGAVLGAHLNVRGGARLVRAAVVLAVAASGVRLLLP
jgi:uncharacterized membrane protein YfcA